MHALVRILDLFGRPWAATIPALATAMLSLIGGYFLWEMRTRTAPSFEATLALGGGAFVVMFVTWLREAGRDRKQKDESARLETAIDNVRQIAQTMPPRTFLNDFDRLFQREAYATERAVQGFYEWPLGEERQELRERINESIRSVLDGILDLAWTWDEASSEPGMVYRVNVMWLVPRRQYERNTVLRRSIWDELLLHPQTERAELLDHASGAMQLDLQLATNSLQRQSANRDVLEPLSLIVGPILEEGVTEQHAIEAVRAANLPGAPTAVTLSRMDYVEDSREFVTHCRKHDLYSDRSQRIIGAHYRNDVRARSIVSFPVKGAVTASGHDPISTIGSVNVYRNHAGIMGDRSRAVQFSLITAPFRSLLFKLMLLRAELDHDAGQPGYYRQKRRSTDGDKS